ncbi:MAG: LysR family transcriptional regulator [Myxococcota bacterium]
MDFDSLKCFAAAADTLNFRAASRRVALSPGAFSERIRRLEEDLGARLFDRTTRRAQLTDAGRRLLPHARQLLRDAERCQEIAQDSAAIVPYAVTVGTRFELGISWLTPSLAQLAKQAPERTIHLYMGDSPDLMARMQRGEIDAAITSTRLTSGTVRYATLHNEDYAFVGTTQRVRGPNDVHDLTLIDVSPDLPLFRYLLDALPDASPWPFDKQLYMGGIAAIRYQILAGLGVGVLPRYFIREDLAAGRLTELMPDQALREDAFRLVWRVPHPFEPELVQLAEELRAIPLT